MAPPSTPGKIQLPNMYKSLHFTHWYDLALYFVFAGALMGFTLSRFMFLDINGIFCNPLSTVGGAAPGECYYYSGASGTNRYRVGILLHLAAILPASFLVCFQFVPVIRHKAIMIHRVSGYVILLLSLAGSSGVYAILDKSFGGEMVTQVINGVLVSFFLISMGISYTSIKRGRIDLHRAWMLRAWSYAGSIISIRLIMMIPETIRGTQTHYTARPCSQVDYMLNSLTNVTLQLYPECLAYYNGTNTNQHALIEAKLGDNPVEASVFISASYAMAGAVALPLHAALVELYLLWTAAFSSKLRSLSTKGTLRGL